MKINIAIKVAALALLLPTLNQQLSIAQAQGVLTPPGAPAPTMKSLDQIYTRLDARIPITNTASSVALVQPGSYYLTGNLTVSNANAITIAVNNVTLDLNGYTVKSTSASAAGYAIQILGLRNITIQNGFIDSGVTNNGSGVYSGSGFGYGIAAPFTFPVNMLVSRVSISGCLYYGIYIGLGDSLVVESCTVRTVGSYGILASTVKNCSAIDCGLYAIFGEQVSDCRGEGYGSGNGIYALGTAQNCYGSSSGTGTGVHASGTALNCYGTSSGSGDGVYTSAAENCYGTTSSGFGVLGLAVQNCYGFSTSGTGIRAFYTALNCYSYSTSGFGLDASVAQNCSASTSSGFYGLTSTIAHNCYGYTGGGGYGIHASELAIGCFGSSGTGTGLYAFVANGCVGQTTAGGIGLSTSHNVNSF